MEVSQEVSPRSGMRTPGAVILMQKCRWMLATLLLAGCAGNAYIGTPCTVARPLLRPVKVAQEVSSRRKLRAFATVTRVHKCRLVLTTLLLTACAGNAHIGTPEPPPSTAPTVVASAKEECFRGTFRVLDTLEVEWPDDSALVDWAGEGTDAYGQVLFIFVKGDQVNQAKGYTAWVNFENTAVLIRGRQICRVALGGGVDVGRVWGAWPCPACELVALSIDYLVCVDIVREYPHVLAAFVDDLAPDFFDQVVDVLRTCREADPLAASLGHTTNGLPARRVADLSGLLPPSRHCHPVVSERVEETAKVERGEASRWLAEGVDQHDVGPGRGGHPDVVGVVAVGSE